MSICVISEAHKYDVRHGFVAGWEGFLHRERTKKATRPTKCTRCALKAVCGMCPANGELENREPEAPAHWLIRTAQLSATTPDIPIVARGDCEYCDGGAGHAALVESAARLRDTSTIACSPAATTKDGRRFLHVVSTEPASGCAACSSH